MKKKQTQTTASPTWAQPYQQEAAKIGNEVFSAQQPRLDEASQNLFGAYNSMSPTAFSNPAVTGALNYAIGQGTGGYQANPYLDEMIGNSANDIGTAVNGAFSRSGMYGSTPHQGVLGRRIGEMSSGMRYQDYDRQMQRQQNMLGMIPALASGQYAGAYPALATLNAATETPFKGLNAYGGLLGNLIGNQGTTTQTKGGNGLGQALGAAATVAAMTLGISDVRLKDNVRRVGETDGGQPIYTYTYKGDNTPHMGVMAQESSPDAVVRHPSGYLMVDYGKVR